MKIAPSVLAALAVIGAILLAGYCGERRGIASERARAGDRRDDSTVSRLAYEVAKGEQRFARERDSTGRVIRALQQRVASQTSPDTTVSGGTNSPAVARTPVVDSSTLAVYDSLVAALTAGRAQDSLQILFWKSQVAQRDTVIQKLQASRDAWRGRSEKRFACVGGVSVAVSLSGRAAVGPGITCGWKF